MFFYFKKYFKVIFILFILILILAYVVNISSIPDNIILFDDSELALQTIAGIKIKQIVFLFKLRILNLKMKFRQLIIFQ